MKILADSTIPLLDYFFADVGDLHTFEAQHIKSSELANVDLLLVRSTVKVNQALISEAKRLKWLGSCVTGKDHLDIEYLNMRNIAYYAAEGCNADSVVDYVQSNIAALQLDGRLPAQGRAAVIGVGRIGSKVTQLLETLGFQVITCDPFRAQEPGFIHTPIEKIQNVDLICVHLLLTRDGEHSSYHLLNQAFFKRQKSGCVLINAGRGETIDETALLNQGGHLTWCLDVFEHEPQVNADVIKHAYIATPHIAGHAIEAKMRGTEMVYQAAAKQFGWPMKSMPVEAIQWQAPEGSWQQKVLAYCDPRAISAEFKQREPAAFHHLRKTYNQRHEFKFISSLHSIIND